MGDEAEYLTDGADYIPQSFFPDKSKPSKVINGLILYRCTRCRKYKPKSDFYSDKRVPCGIRNKCKKCYHKKAKGGAA